jgi:type VI secretion system protein ImpK
MAEEPKQTFDPDATVAQPLGAADPEATITQPIGAVADPEATITQPLRAADPDATVTGPAPFPGADAEATDRRASFDPDATDRRPVFDPEATFRTPSLGKVRRNPFAPKAPPETIQANLSALGGLNPLVAMANPILAAIPQIRRALRHPDPAGLLAGLRDQIEQLEMSAISAEIADDTVSAAVYALCALLDESAAATPWGTNWIEQGLLQNLRGESDGAQGFFTQLEALMAEPEKHADLLEFYYICLALGFEGRYRSGDGGRPALDQLREQLYGLITRRRPRPEALSAQWRTPTSIAAAEAALQTAARATAARAAAEAAAQAAAAAPRQPQYQSRFALSRWPRRAIWSAVAGFVGAALVFYMLALRLLDDETRNAMSPLPGLLKKKPSLAAGGPASAPAAQAAAALAASAALAKALEGAPLTIKEEAGQLTLAPHDERQFASGSAQPSAGLRALAGRIAEALDKQPGSIVVAGYADASPAGARYASNADLSAARARAVADLMAKKLGDPKRVLAEGRGDAEPLAPNDSAANRAKNRRVAILVKP